MSIFNRHKTELISADEALPGRVTASILLPWSRSEVLVSRGSHRW